MKKEDFLKTLVKVLEFDEDEIILTLTTDLNELDDYDSFSVLSIIAFIHKNFGLQLTARQLRDVDTPQDLILLIGEDKFE